MIRLDSLPILSKGMNILIGHVIDAREYYTGVVYEAAGEYGYLDVVGGWLSLRTGDVLDGNIDSLRRTIIKVNNRDEVEVNICYFGNSEADARKWFSAVC